MLFKSEIVTQVSGSIAGTTYSHNSAGLYRRARSIPVNPNSAAQQGVRSNLTTLSQAWNAVLTQVQRDAWDNYATLSPITGKLGDELVLSGQQMYIRCNTVRLLAGVARVDAGPTVPGLIALTTPVTTISIGAATLSTAFETTDAWANVVGGGLNIQTSRFISGGRNFFKGPYRFNQVVLGAGAPPASPDTEAENAFNQLVADATAGQKCSMRYTAFEDDGRISAVQSELVTIVV